MQQIKGYESNLSTLYIYPHCDSKMTLTTDSSSNLRICAECQVIQWEHHGKTETRYPGQNRLIEESPRAQITNIS